MIENMYLAIDMTEISKAEYDKVRERDKAKLLIDKSFGFVTHVSNRVYTAYLNHNGKYYRGELEAGQSYRDMEDFVYMGVAIRAPQAVFKRKPAPVKKVA